LNEQAAKIAASRLDHVSTLPRAQWSQDELARVRSLDTVLLLDVLEHMYNPWGELEFLAKHLPADAQVIVSIPNIRHVSILESLARGAFPYAPTGILDITHIRFFTPAGMEQMFNETGFEVEQTWILTMSQTTKIERFPAQVSAGKLTLTVESEQEWDQLNAVQFGFRLRPKPRA
jgi:2-polyprenyl-3-methyl-5-hydroxy-6-metoxy-1,4-benzoquinol methylase